MGRNGTGVRAISDSSIELTFSYRGHRCRERLKLKPTAANLKRAGDFLGAVRDAIAKGTFDYAVSFPGSPRIAKFAARVGDARSVEAYLLDWLARQEKILKASTYDGYRKIVKGILIPKFGVHRLSDLRRSHVREWAAEQTFSNKRMTNVLSVLRAALAEATQDEVIDANPLAGWNYQRNDAPKEEDDVDPFTAAEQQAILAEFTEEQERNVFRFAFWTGLRTSELIGLQWKDLDESRGLIRVQRARTRTADKDEDTKTTAGRRDVKLLGPALAALESQKAFTLLQGGAVFMNPRTGKAWTGDQVLWAAWGRAIRKAKVRYRRPYQTRHTYASMMLTAGESPMWVAQQMGHASWMMIARRYGRWVKDAAPDAGSKAVALFAGNDSISPPTAREA